MAYQNPAFAWYHLLRVAGSGALTLTTGSLASGTLARLLDNLARGSKLLQITAAASTVEIDADLDGITLPDVNRLLVPAGHNLDTATITVSGDDNSGFSSATQLGQVVSPGAGVIDLALSPSVTERYLRLAITSAPATVEIGEAIFSERFSITEGIEPRDWIDRTVGNVRVDELPVIDFTTELSEPRRELFLGWNRLGSTSKSALDALVSGVGVVRDPFVVWSPDDSFDPAWVRLLRDPESRQGSPNPAGTGPQYDYEMRMRERLG